MKMTSGISCLFALLWMCVASAQASDRAEDTPGSNQFGQPETIELVLEIGKKWAASGVAPFGVGDMSLADGAISKKHLATGDHRTGLGIDIRPIRKDGQSIGVRWQDPAYDRAATQKLVDMLNATGRVDRIVFGDSQIKGIKTYRGLDDHLHVTVKPRPN